MRASVSLDVDWKAFLSRADLIFQWGPKTALPLKWYHSAFIGNGKLGMLIRANNASSLRLAVSSTSTYDDRMPGSPYAKDNNFVCDRPRLPLGAFSVNYAGALIEASMRMLLWDGVVVGSITTDQGSMSFRAFANNLYDKADVMVFEYNASMPVQVTFTPSLAASTWATRGECQNYTYNPPVVMLTEGDVTVATQPHLSGTEHATAFATVTQAARRAPSGLEVTPRSLVISISDVMMHGKEAAVANVTAAIAYGLDALLQGHTQWWHEYYPASFLTLSDTRLEEFYWINMYKLASATRGDRVVYDLMGPWFIDHTPWPDLHWDLNIQLTYWPLYAANRLDLVRSLTRLMDDRVEQLSSNVLPEFRADSAAGPSGASSLECFETCYWNYGQDCLITPPTVTGNLLWVMQLYYQVYEYSLDTEVLKQMLPLFTRAVNFYLHWQIDNATDHMIHLPPTYSPEYATASDCNYDLALYKWALTTIINICDNILHVTTPTLPAWRDTLRRLTPQPVGPDGFLIGAGVPLSSSHRHASHLFSIFPLRTLNLSDAGDMDLAVRSVDHWIGLSGALTGFARTFSSPMSVLFGRKAAAYGNITFLLDGYILPNTFYHEGEDGECGETPPAASSAVQDWMLMAWGGTIHVFAGIDDGSLTDAAFFHLLAPGAFLVSARRANGTTAFVEIISQQGASLRVKTDLSPPLTLQPAFPYTTLPDGTLDIALPRGQSVLIFSAQAPPSSLTITASQGNPTEFNYWGFQPVVPLASVVLHPCAGLPEQRFAFDPSNSRSLITHNLTGSGQQLCVGSASCTAPNGDAIVLQTCPPDAVGSLSPSSPLSSQIACEGDANVQWTLDRKKLLYVAASGRCMDVNGAVGPVLDVWDCSPQAEYQNTAWMYNATDGSIRSLDTHPLFTAGHCLTVVPARPKASITSKSGPTVFRPMP